MVSFDVVYDLFYKGIISNASIFSHGKFKYT